MTVLRHWRAALISVAGVMAIAGVTYGALTAVGIDFGRGGSAEEEVTQQKGTHLAEKRDRLAICVQSAGFAPEGAGLALELSAKSSLESALVEVTKHRLWERFRTTEPQPIVDIGCGVEPAIYNPDVSFFDDEPPQSFLETRGRQVTQPSYYRVLVFILSTDEMNRLLGEPPFRLTTEESTCSGDSCAGVTTGLYLSPEEISDIALITDNLEKALGFERPF